MKNIKKISWGFSGICILFLVSTVSAAVPVASFYLTFNNTSTNTPTSWQWNATNLIGNKTPFTFSTSQHPQSNLGKGNWLIQLIATNSGGSNTSSTRSLGINLTSIIVYYWNRVS